MITPTQMRAARAMLDVSQGYVAQHLGIAANTLSKIESGQSDISMSRLKEIQKFYECENIEFTYNDGVKWNTTKIITHEGQQGIRDFFDDVYVAAQTGNDISLFNGVPHLLIKWLGDDFYQPHVERMSLIENKPNFKIIVEENETNFIANSFAEYKWFPKEMFNDRTIYIYGGKVGFFTFSDDNVVINVISNIELASSMAVLFDIAWHQVAREPS